MDAPALVADPPLAAGSAPLDELLELDDAQVPVSEPELSPVSLSTTSGPGSG